MKKEIEKEVVAPGANMSEESKSEHKEIKVPDWRHIDNGYKFATEYYADQPYIVKAGDGAWVCVVTTNSGKEGAPGQYIATMRSEDLGRTWTSPVPVEEPDGREASYAVILKTPYGRIYVFYNHNTDNIRRVKADNPPYTDGYCYRVDSLGYFVFKYSDDSGKSWSDKRYTIPVREFEIDRKNADRGKIRYFWNVGKAIDYQGFAYVPLHKVGGFGDGFFTSNEGVLLRSDNLLTEKDPEKINWETLPDGDVGIKTPPGGGPIAGEHSFSVLSDGSFYVVFRTIDGHPCEAYSRDCGKTWTTPRYKRYADGRLMKHPRAATFAWRCSNGKFLYWFHNNGGRWYEDRNPVWVCSGEEFDTQEGLEIKWSHPEIMIYTDDPYVRISYPDIIEDEGRLFITETNKYKGRVHEIDREFLDKLWSQFDINKVEEKGLIFERKRESVSFPSEIKIPELPVFLERDHDKADYGTKDLRRGFSIDMWVKPVIAGKNIILIDSRADNGEGLCVEVGENNSIGIILNDGRTQNSWYSEPGVLKTGKIHHIGIIVDAGPKIISFVIDGRFCDGGDYRQFGWGRFSRDLRHANGVCMEGEELKVTTTSAIKDFKRTGRATVMRTADSKQASIEGLRFYGRALLTTELIGNYRAGM